MTRRPSVDGAAARLKDCFLVSIPYNRFFICDVTDVITLFPCPTSTEAETNKGGPCAALEEEDGEDDAEAETEARADDHGGEAAVPLEMYCQP